MLRDGNIIHGDLEKFLTKNRLSPLARNSQPLCCLRLISEQAECR